MASRNRFTRTSPLGDELMWRLSDVALGLLEGQGEGESTGMPEISRFHECGGEDAEFPGFILGFENGTVIKVLAIELPAAAAAGWLAEQVEDDARETIRYAIATWLADTLGTGDPEEIVDYRELVGSGQVAEFLASGAWMRDDERKLALDMVKWVEANPED